jgi:hypothetical protein
VIGQTPVPFQIAHGQKAGARVPFGEQHFFFIFLLSLNSCPSRKSHCWDTTAVMGVALAMCVVTVLCSMVHGMFPNDSVDKLKQVTKLHNIAIVLPNESSPGCEPVNPCAQPSASDRNTDADGTMALFVTKDTSFSIQHDVGKPSLTLTFPKCLAMCLRWKLADPKPLHVDLTFHNQKMYIGSRDNKFYLSGCLHPKYGPLPDAAWRFLGVFPDSDSNYWEGVSWIEPLKMQIFRGLLGFPATKAFEQIPLKSFQLLTTAYSANKEDALEASAFTMNSMEMTAGRLAQDADSWLGIPPRSEFVIVSEYKVIGKEVREEVKATILNLHTPLLLTEGKLDVTDIDSFKNVQLKDAFFASQPMERLLSNDLIEKIVDTLQLPWNHPLRHSLLQLRFIEGRKKDETEFQPAVVLILGLGDDGLYVKLEFSHSDWAEFRWTGMQPFAFQDWDDRNFPMFRLQQFFEYSKWESSECVTSINFSFSNVFLRNEYLQIKDLQMHIGNRDKLFMQGKATYK